MGIMILLAFSMPLATPMAMMTRAAARPITSHTLLPTPKIPPRTIMPTASPMVSAPGAAASKAGPIRDISCPIAYRPPERDKKVYLKIQLITTV